MARTKTPSTSPETSSPHRTRTRKKRMPTGDEQSASFFSESLLKDVPSLQKFLEASPEDPTRQGLERLEEAIEKMSAEAAHQQYETALLRGAGRVRRTMEEG